MLYDSPVAYTGYRNQPKSCFMKGATMNNDISQEYIILFRAITQAIASLDEMREQLVKAQLVGEQLYIEKTAEPQ